MLFPSTSSSCTAGSVRALLMGLYLKLNYLTTKNSKEKYEQAPISQTQSQTSPLPSYPTIPNLTNPLPNSHVVDAPRDRHTHLPAPFHPHHRPNRITNGALSTPTPTLPSLTQCLIPKINAPPKLLLHIALHFPANFSQAAVQK